MKSLPTLQKSRLASRPKHPSSNSGTTPTFQPPLQIGFLSQNYAPREPLNPARKLQEINFARTNLLTCPFIRICISNKTKHLAHKTHRPKALQKCRYSPRLRPKKRLISTRKACNSARFRACFGENIPGLLPLRPPCRDAANHLLQYRRAAWSRIDLPLERLLPGIRRDPQAISMADSVQQTTMLFALPENAGHPQAATNKGEACEARRGTNGFVFAMGFCVVASNHEKSQNLSRKTVAAPPCRTMSNQKIKKTAIAAPPDLTNMCNKAPMSC